MWSQIIYWYQSRCVFFIQGQRTTSILLAKSDQDD